MAALRPDIVGPLGLKLDAWLEETGAKLPRKR